MKCATVDEVTVDGDVVGATESDSVACEAGIAGIGNAEPVGGKPKKGTNGNGMNGWNGTLGVEDDEADVDGRSGIGIGIGINEFINDEGGGENMKLFPIDDDAAAATGGSVRTFD